MFSPSLQQKGKSLLRLPKISSQQHAKLSVVEQNSIRKVVSHQEQLQQLLTCHICYCIAKDLVMCPFCSKIYCQVCVKKSIFIKQECPHCRKHIRDVKSMANCSRFVNQMKEIVEDVLKQKQKQNFRCEVHDVPLNYFCLQCERSVCCQCKMFGQHIQHQLIQIQKKYQQKYQKTRSLLAQLKVCIKQKQDYVSKLQKQNYLNQTLHQTQMNQLQKMQKSYNQKFAQCSQKDRQLVKQNLNRLESVLEQLSLNKKEIKLQVNKAKKDRRYNFAHEIRLMLQNSIQSLNCQLNKVQINLSTTPKRQLISDLIPQYNYNTFTIQNFTQTVINNPKCVIYSQPVSVHDCLWKLKIYPNGSQSVQGKYLSIYIVMVSKCGYGTKKGNLGSNQNLNLYEYIIEIVREGRIQLEQSWADHDRKMSSKSTQSLNKNFSRQYSSAFAPGESWGYNKYIQLAQLNKGRFINPEMSDRLVIKYGIRRPDYFTEHKSLQKQLENIQTQILQSQKQLDQVKAIQINEQVLQLEEKTGLREEQQQDDKATTKPLRKQRQQEDKAIATPKPQMEQTQETQL